ncbi:MAG: RimK family alpha-L-glutamate ligase [Clostridiales bacterium]|nr:RimK family alpha-L-glutamate ligase [Clostridiales bacterium]
MSIALVTNGFFLNDKTEEIRRLLADGFSSHGVRPIQLRNSELYADVTERLAGVDTVLFWDKDVLLARRIEAIGKKVINCSAALELCDHKGKSAVALANAGIDMPKTIVAPFTYQNIGYTSLDFLSEVTKALDFPIVVKECHGSFGQQVYLAKDYGELCRIVTKTAARPIIFQQYIECGSSDLRLQVVGDRVVAAVKRTSQNGDFRANATLGGIMTDYKPTADEIELALAAARAVKAEIAGVDILPGDKPLLCEVNANAHFKRLMDATGVDVASIIAEYVIDRV